MTAKELGLQLGQRVTMMFFYYFFPSWIHQSKLRFKPYKSQTLVEVGIVPFPRQILSNGGDPLWAMPYGQSSKCILPCLWTRPWVHVLSSKKWSLWAWLKKKNSEPTIGSPSDRPQRCKGNSSWTIHCTSNPKPAPKSRGLNLLSGGWICPWDLFLINFASCSTDLQNTRKKWVSGHIYKWGYLI